MSLTYFKRFRMEYNVAGPIFEPRPLPRGYAFLRWRASLFDAHVDVKFRSFKSEVDANVFTCFHDRDSCGRLMTEIANRHGFLPQATWLLSYSSPRLTRSEPCGTIQGVHDQSGLGAIQNIGVLPTHRGHGLGTALIHRSLLGFREAGLERVYLEVTAQNAAAVRLYLRLGFKKVKTVYKAADVAYV